MYVWFKVDNEEEVFEYLRRYEKLEDMPQHVLDKVLLYYENMKQADKKQVFQEQPY